MSAGQIAALIAAGAFVVLVLLLAIPLIKLGRTLDEATIAIRKAHTNTDPIFTEANTTILGVSVDSTWSNRAFREQLGVQFPILSDWKREAAKAYGLYDENAGIARRATFVVDKTGIVRKVDVNREALDPSGVVGMCQKLESQ